MSFLARNGFNIGAGIVIFSGAALGANYSPAPPPLKDPIYATPPKTNTEDAYDLSNLGRGTAFAVSGVTDTVSGFADGYGGWQQGQGDRSLVPKMDPKYRVKEDRDLFSRRSRVGRTFKKMSGVNGKLSQEEAYALHDKGAGRRAFGNAISILPQLIRLGFDGAAIEKLWNGNGDNGWAEKSVIYGDTVTATSHIADISLYAAGLRLGSLGNYAKGAKILGLSIKLSFISNIAQLITSGSRIYAELEKEEQTGQSDPSTYVYGIIDAMWAVYFLIFNTFILRRVSDMKAKQKKSDVKTDKGAKEALRKQFDTLTGFTDVPSLVQGGMRYVGAFGGSTNIGLNLAVFLKACSADTPALFDYLVPIAVSSALGCIAGMFAIGAGLTYSGIRLSLTRTLTGFCAAFVGVKGLYDGWDEIASYFTNLF